MTNPFPSLPTLIATGITILVGAGGGLDAKPAGRPREADAVIAKAVELAKARRRMFFLCAAKFSLPTIAGMDYRFFFYPGRSDPMVVEDDPWVECFILRKGGAAMAWQVRLDPGPGIQPKAGTLERYLARPWDEFDRRVRHVRATPPEARADLSYAGPLVMQSNLFPQDMHFDDFILPTGVADEAQTFPPQMRHLPPFTDPVGDHEIAWMREQMRPKRSVPHRRLRPKAKPRSPRSLGKEPR